MIPLRELISSWGEAGLGVDDEGSLLDRVEIEDFNLAEGTIGTELELVLAFEHELGFAIPGLSGVGLYLGRQGQPTIVGVKATLAQEWEVRLVQTEVVLRLGSVIAKPVHRAGAGFEVATGSDGAALPYEIVISGIDAVYRASGGLGIETPTESPSIALPAMMLGDTGIIIEGSDLSLHFGDGTPPAGQPAGWRGIHIGHAALYLPGGLLGDSGVLQVDNWLIGTGGVSGSVSNVWTSPLPTSLFGVDLKLHSVSIVLVQNIPTAASIKAEMLLPFFDEPAKVEIGIGVTGDLHVGLDSTGPNGLYTLTKPGILEVELDSIAFEVKDGNFSVKLSGKLLPLFGADKGLKWPQFDVKDLTIDSEGVHIPGGWLTLAEQKTFDFHGFKIEISQIGFGKNDDGSKWVGFSGGLKLVGDLQAGASVEGLRITWFPQEMHRDPRITLNGVGVELTIPDVLWFKGAVSYNEIKNETTGEVIHRFDGEIHLKLVSLDLSVDGILVVGTSKGPLGKYTFFALYVDVELPVGIPLAQTGLAIYGFAGLFALNMEPNKKPEQKWFSVNHDESWYHKDEVGVTNLKKKWDPVKGSFALGAGISLATYADTGYSFNGKFLLVLVFPGPLLMIDGSGNILKKTSEGQEEGLFRAVTILDARRGDVLIGLDAQYKTGKQGQMIEMACSVEAYFNYFNPSLWHLYLGIDEPRQYRIRALFGRFVEANAYFMLDAHHLGLGAWFGYDNRWTFGPLSVVLQAWADGKAVISFKPTHFHGELCLHGEVALKAFKWGFGLTVDACIEADLFKPYHLKGEFSVAIDLPKPFKDISATIVLEWGPEKAAPPLPLPLAKVAVEHFESTVVWPLPRNKFLLPSWDDGDGLVGSPVGGQQPADFSKIPVIPLDARISLTFGRSVHDDAQVGVNPQEIVPAVEEIGAPGGGAVVTARYGLTSVALRRWDGLAWQLVARSPKTGSTPALFGAWSAVPQLPDAGAQPPRPGQTKLLLWAKTPFDFTRNTGSSWDEWVSDAWPGYPCIPELPAHETCFGFADLAPGTQIASPWTVSGPPALTVSWGFGPAVVDTRRVPEAGVVKIVHVLCFPAAAVRRGLRIVSAEPGRSFRIVLARGSAPGPAPAPLPVAEDVGTTDDASTCVDLRRQKASTVTNPWTSGGLRFIVRGADDGLLPVARLERWGTGPFGLNAGFRLDVELPCASPRVELLVTHRPPFRIVAFNAAGAAVATHAPQGTGGEVTETVLLQGPGIKRLEIHAAGNEKLVHRVCWSCPPVSGPSATGYDGDHVPYGPFLPEGGVIEVTGPELPEVVVTGDGPLCLEQICVTPDPEAGQGVRRDEAIRHIAEELARWQAEGDVLAPNSTYRLEIQTTIDAAALNSNVVGLPGHQLITENAYFRTQGPPGLTQLSRPEGTDVRNPFETGLEDLTLYVRQTDPRTVPLPGEKPIRFEPFYRAYDVGVEFKEDYVEQMYRMDRRDLGLYLFDASNQPARDARGRLLALTSGWGRAETLALSDKETRWVTLVDAATCLSTKLDPATFPKDATLASAEEGRVLAPSTLYEARLITMLVHEAFAEGAPGAMPPGWTAADEGPGGPSLWRLMEEGEPPARHVEQASVIGGSGEPDRPGTVLLLADLAAADWTDVRLSVYVRSAAGGAVGVVFRHGGPGRWYRFALHESRRRLVKAGAEGVTVLAEDHAAHQRNRDYLLTVEAIGTSLRAFVDGEPVFAVEDAELAKGRIGLYACQSPGARFTDVRVDDFRPGAPVVYRFQLATSLYANFFHHVHSFDDRIWTGSLGADAEPALQQAVPFSFNPPKESETRAYKDLADKALGPAAALQNPQRVEVMRLERSGQVPVLLLRSPEPLGWGRVQMELSRPTRWLSAPDLPDEVKLTDVTFGATQPEEESVTLLLREGLELTRHRIEARLLPGPGIEPPGDPILLLEGFRAPGSLARFEIVDQGRSGGPSQWLIEGGALIQLSAIGGGFEPALPGTQAVTAVTGDSAWSDYRLTVDLRSDSGGSVGVVFRWRDADNHYRFSVDATLRYRRLVKVEAGAVSVLWEDGGRYTPGEPFRLIVEAVGSRLTGFFGGTRLFQVSDSAHAAGRVGFYVWNDPTARFEMLEVRRPSQEALGLAFSGWQLDEPFDALVPGRWSFFDETGASAPEPWLVEGGMLRCLPEPIAWKEPGGGLNGDVHAIAVAGDEVFVGGAFTLAGAVPAHRIAVWSGGNWKALGGGVNGTVRAIAVEGDRVYVGGQFTEAGGAPAQSIAVWSRSLKTWSALGSGVAGPVRALAVIGDRVYAGGLFATAGGVPADNIAAWNTSTRTWEAVGGGVNGWVLALARRGSFLYAGGGFGQAGGKAASRIALWDGQAWVASGGKINGSVTAVAVGEEGLYIGGTFSEAGGVAVSRIARWTGSAWTPLDAGLNDVVGAIVLAGNQVWVGGRFTQAGSVAVSRIARWNRATRTWVPVGAGMDGDVQALALDPDRIWAGGGFATAGVFPARRIAALPLGGTRFAVADEPGSEEFRLAVRLVLGPDGGTAVVLRWQDPANHLAFWLDAERGFRRLIQTKGGKAETLWEDAVRPEVGREYAVALDAIGGRLAGFLDGVELFDLSLAPAAGRFGLAERRSPRTRFREVLWGIPAWSVWHAFGDEEWLPAGTRVRVHAGPISAPASEAGLTLRSSALAGESGRLRFSSHGTELRLVQPDGSFAHARTFLPDGAYVPVVFAVVRKADGTGLSLVPQSSAADAAGPLRLKLTYHRDRTEAGRRFSQAGDHGPERVVIDIP